MVKPDYDRDYYADLGLPPGADISAIRKQYRSLVLKYHPDRNPGQEERAKERFVVIQAANEILSDPVHKSKYDANRRSATPGTSASGTRGNPYSNVSRDMSDMFGAPPKRAARQQPTPYSNWGVPQSAPKPKTTGTPFDNLRAWDRMRSSKAPTAAASDSAGPRTSSPKPPPKPAAQPPPPPPRTAYQARQQEASFGNARRTGFAPASPMGDEPQVKSNNYNNNYNSYTSNLFAETAANLRKAAHAQARPASAHADGPSDDYDGSFMDTRQRTPYASNVGEKTNPFEGASTTRPKEAWRKAQEEEPASSPPRPARQRSASVGERDGFPKPATKAPQGAVPNGFAKPPPTRFASQASERYSPRPPGDAKPPRPPKVPEAQPAPAPQKAPASGAPPASKPNVYGAPFNTFPKSSFPPPFFSSQFQDFCGADCYYCPSASPSHSGRQAEDSSWFTGEARGASTRGPTPPVHAPAPSGAAVPDYGVRWLEQLFNDQFDILLKGARSSRATYERAQAQRSYSHTNSTFPTSFTVPDDDDTPEPQTPKANPASQQARFMRNSTESINTRFVADDNPSKYQFNAGGPPPIRDPLRPDPFLRAKQRSRSTPRGGATSAADGPASPPIPPANPLQPEVPKPSAFDAGQWQQKIGPHNFVPPPVARQASSPTRPTRVAKKPKASKVPTGAVVIDISSSSETEGPQPMPTPAHARPTMQSAPSPNAMDIDPPSFEDVGTPSGARTINVEPSKPEWRPGHVSGLSPDITTAGGPSAPPPKPPKVAEPEDVPIFKEMFNVEPFAAPQPAGVGGSGLGGFGDMKLNLPFPSQAAATTPLEKEKEQQQPKEDPIAAHFKVPPPCPHVPICLTLTHSTPETGRAWADYAGRFHKYLRDWTAYERRIVEHFVARKRVREEAGDAAFAWVHVRGDAVGKRYRRELEQDRMVRKKWDEFAEEHEARVKEFAAVHKRVEEMLPVPAYT